MKFLKAKIYIDQDAGSTRYTYPQVWLDNKERIPLIGTPNDREIAKQCGDQAVDEKGTYQVLYPLVPDDLVDTLLALDGVTVATAEEVDAFSETHLPKREVVNDQHAVLGVLVKQARGEVLTKADNSVLDPTTDTPGTTLSKSLVELANPYGYTNQ